MKRSLMAAALVALVGLLMFTSPTQAAISVVNTDNVVGDPSPGGISIDYNVQQAGSVLVVGSYTDTMGAALKELDFGGNAADGAIEGSRTSMFYYLNPAVGNITISSAAEVSNSSGLFVWELSGVDLTAQVRSVVGVRGHESDSQITTIADNSFIVDVVGFNTSSTLNPDVVLTAPDDVNSILTKMFDFDVNVAGGGGFMSGATAVAGPAGTHDLGWTVTFTNGDSPGNLNELAFAFAPAVVIPTPAALPAGLMMLGLFGVCRRHR